MKAPDTRIKGPRVTIRPLYQADLDVMSTWPEFQDPLDKLFSWPQRSFRANEIWFSQLVRDRTRVYFAVENESQTLIGRISLREIQGRQSARLGIGFRSDYVDQGYGTESLRVFLGYYFLDMGFDQMVLDVSAVNERAIRCYERCGFRYVGSHYQYAGTDDEVAFLQDERYKDVRRFFKREYRQNSMLVYDMMLRKKEWLVQERAK
jgi:RimJ/RimL family protein N-acetyltransferase